MKTPFNRLILLTGISLLNPFFTLTSLAQTNNGPNAGSIQQQMMGPGFNRYGRMPDMFYGPVSAQEMGLPPKGYESPVIIRDGVINGKVVNPTLRPLRPLTP